MTELADVLLDQVVALRVDQTVVPHGYVVSGYELGEVLDLPHGSEWLSWALRRRSWPESFRAALRVLCAAHGIQAGCNHLDVEARRDG